MHATTRNLPTCSALKCGQPATVVVARCAPPEEIRLAVDGSVYLIEHDPVDIDYCSTCAGRLG
jgi:hypothetical protein